jgi:ABC-type uncharacterized transport system permease subunit
VRGRFDPQRILLLLAAPILALAVGMVLTSIVLLISGDSPFSTFRLMWDYGNDTDSIVSVVNKATTYYLSALAVAIGFRMNLFNIGVDGQYRMAAIVAALVGAKLSLPGPLDIFVIVLAAALVGALWAGIAGLLKVTRGVSEVISTIMLNFVATGLVAYLLQKNSVSAQGSNNISTDPIPANAHFPAFHTSGGVVFGFIVVAALAGVLYSLLLGRTRFGFDLRATGLSEPAAVASGVNVKRMVLVTMLISGAIAGLVGMPQLLGESYSYSLDFPSGYGFTGIAIALLGRNNPIGIAFGALLWSFLERSAQILDLEGIPKEIVTIMQGTIVLAVVVAYELVRRFGLAAQQRQVGEGLASPPGGAAQPATTGAGV